MSDRRYTAIFGAAVLIAGGATLSVYRMLSAAASPRREPTRPVVLVAQDVPAGVPVPREALARVLWPSRVALPEAFGAVDSVAGRVTRVPLTRGEPVRATALAPRGAAPGLEGTITPDHRAIAVRVGEAAGVSGLVRPNSRVDVLVTNRGDTDGVTARLVMADVRVLGVGSARPADATAGDAKEPVAANIASVVTLEVTPMQAAQLAAAEGQGTIQVVLRGFGSTTPAPDAGDGRTEAVAASAPGDMPGGASGGARGGAWPPMFGAGGGRQGRTPPAPPSAPERRIAHEGPRPAVAPAAVAAIAPTRPDSVTVRIYRGGQMTVLHVESSTPGTPAAPPVSPPPGPAPVRTAVLGAH